MGKTNVQRGSGHAKHTTIAVMQAAWQEAFDAQNATEEYAFTLGNEPGDSCKKSHLGDANKEAYERSRLLQHAIVRQQPVTRDDALILAAQITNIGVGIDLTVEQFREQEFASLDEGLQNLLAFLASEHSCDVGSALQSTIDCAVRAVARRTGRPALGTDL